jgi:nitrate reductase NapE component
MFMDEVVLAGIIIVVLTAAFLGGFGYFVWKDAHKKGKRPS